MSTTIYLCRHAAYQNPKDIFHGRLPGFPLSSEGRKQARRLAEALKDKPIAAIYSSPLTRAYQTAEIVASYHKLSIVTDQRLLDIRTPLEGQSLQFIDSKKIQGNFYRKEFIDRGGETLREIADRMQSFLSEKVRQYPGQEIVVVGHGDPIMTVKVRFHGQRLALKNIRPDYLGMGQCYKIVYSDNGIIRTFSSF